LASFRDFYSQLYTEEPVDGSLNDIFLSNLPKVADVANQSLCRDISKEEILKTLKEMDPDKSPGSDGFTPKLYIAFFDVLGDVVLSIFNESYSVGHLTDTHN